MAEHTPGPFRFGQSGVTTGRDNVIADDRRKVWVLAFPYDSRGADLDQAERDELVDLLNKGTHFARLLEAAKTGRGHIAQVMEDVRRRSGAILPGHVRHLAEIDAAIAECEGG